MPNTPSRSDSPATPGSAAGIKVVGEVEEFKIGCPSGAGIQTAATLGRSVSTESDYVPLTVSEIAEMRRAKSSGVCVTCPDSREKTLYGCGRDGYFCRDCNNIWLRLARMHNTSYVPIREVAAERRRRQVGLFSWLEFFDRQPLTA